MASWRPPGSILEAPGLHFGGSGPHFRRLWTSYLEPRTPRTPKNLPKQNLDHKVARPPKGGWAAVIPPGGFQLKTGSITAIRPYGRMAMWPYGCTAIRPSSPSTPDQPRIDPKSTPNRPRIDPESITNRNSIDHKPSLNRP